LQNAYNNQRIVAFFYGTLQKLEDICTMILRKLVMKHHFLLLFICCLSLIVNAQEDIRLTVEWQNPKTIVFEGNELIVPNFNNQSIIAGEYHFVYREEVAPKLNVKLTVASFATSAATSNDLEYILLNGVEVLEEVKGEFKLINGAEKRYIVIDFLPYIKLDGQIKRITELVVNKSNLPAIGQNFNKSFASESVLRAGTGDWYKISVTRDGIHKIDKAFLTALGINTEGLNPSNINIYGNGDGRLPEANSVYRTDDLALNTIFIEGEGDGSFDDGDYILFYAWGPDRWYAKSNGRFEQDKNIYSNQSFYFININASNVPARIQNYPSIAAPATHTINSYSFRAIHENDLVNVVSAGQRWYGELFDVNLSQNFNFSVPNPVVGHVSTITTALASNARNSVSGTYTYSVNGVQSQTGNLPIATSPDWGRAANTFNFTNGASTVGVNLTINRLNPDIMTYLDRIELNTRRNLVFYGNQFNFSDLTTIGAGNIGLFSIASFPQSNGFVWNVSRKQQPTLIQGDLVGSNFEFKALMDSVTEFVASDGVNFLIPTRVGKVTPQNLHALAQADYLIVANKLFLSQANRLADLHRATGLSVNVATTEEIYNEFSGGAVDATGIKMFAKMFYDRSVALPGTAPKYLCLFGDGTFDPKNRVANNNNYIVTYQVVGGSSTEHHIWNVVTDDYFGFLDNSESSSSSDMVDIGIGRLLISDNQMAKEQVDKIEHYMKNGSTMFTANNVNCIDGVSTSTFGDWRTKVVNIADDEDFFFNVQEAAYTLMKSNYPDFNTDKLYLDAFTQTVTAGGVRFPQVNNAINERFGSGSLVMNYVGHGGEVGLSATRIVTIPQIQALRNIDNMPLVITATCEFTKFDDPDRVSAGEWMVLNPTGGAISLISTTRSFFYSDADIAVDRFFQNAFVLEPNGDARTFGKILMELKRSFTSGSDPKMALCLFGDPGLKLAIPKYTIVVDSVDGISPALAADTIMALSKVKVKAHLEDGAGNVLTGFNGVATPSLYDKPKQMQTLGHNPGPTITNANVKNFELQRSVIYRGKSTVTNGHFSFEFVTPKDIDYAFGNGKFSLYANNTNTDAIGSEVNVIVGGINPNGLNDDVGPEINLFLNNENFVNGGITNEIPFLIAKITDENGINTVGNGIGHDITAVLDGETGKPIVLNEYYTSDLDTYQSGEIRYQFNKLSPGNHVLVLKVWDVNNNSSEERIEFVVQESAGLQLDHVLNYPNPFTTNTDFYFEHNQCCTDLETQIQIFTVTGKLVKTINQLVNTSGFRSEGINWDGKDDFGDQLAKGVYVYRLKVRTPTGEMAEKLEKLVLLR